MNLAELESLLLHHDHCKREGWRGHDAYAAALVIVRDRPPQGFCIQTPFGRCRILNCQEKEGRIQTVFAVSRAQLAGTIKKLKDANRKLKGEV